VLGVASADKVRASDQKCAGLVLDLSLAKAFGQTLSVVQARAEESPSPMGNDAECTAVTGWNR
jgi:hypothetical protein